MNRLRHAVFFFEEDSAIGADSKPLMLEPLLSRPLLARAVERLRADGIQRFFVVCSPRFENEARACFPAQAEVTLSEQAADLSAFLTTPDPVLVFPRAACPMPEAGPGFVYAAPGYELQEAWRQRMTNNVQGAELVPGWLPIYGQDTIAEIEALLRSREGL